MKGGRGDKCPPPTFCQNRWHLITTCPPTFRKPLTPLQNVKSFIKGGLISESLAQILKKGLKSEIMTEHYQPKEKMLRVVIWHLFFEI